MDGISWEILLKWVIWGLSISTINHGHLVNGSFLFSPHPRAQPRSSGVATKGPGLASESSLWTRPATAAGVSFGDRFLQAGLVTVRGVRSGSIRFFVNGKSCDLKTPSVDFNGIFHDFSIIN